MTTVDTIVNGDNIVASEVDGVRSGDFEKYALIFPNGDVKRLLVVLGIV